MSVQYAVSSWSSAVFRRRRFLSAGSTISPRMPPRKSELFRVLTAWLC